MNVSTDPELTLQETDLPANGPLRVPQFWILLLS